MAGHRRRQLFGIPGPGHFADAAGRLGIGPGSRVIVYSQGKTMWATRMWWLLRYIGFDDVSVLDGGLTAWSAAGLPTGSTAVVPHGREFRPEPRPRLLARRADVERAIDDGDTCLVNALGPAAFRGDGVASYSRPGRIPGSRNVPAEWLVDPQTQRFTSASALLAVLT